MVKIHVRGDCSEGALIVYDEHSAMRDRFYWARLLAFVTGLVNQELLLRNEYLAAENRILRAHLPSRLQLSDAERSTLAEIAKRLGRKALKEIALPNQTQSSIGIDGWLRRSSTGPGAALIPAALESHPKSSKFSAPVRELG